MIKTTNPHFSQNRVSRDSLPTQSSNYAQTNLCYFVVLQSEILALRVQIQIVFSEIRSTFCRPSALQIHKIPFKHFKDKIFLCTTYPHFLNSPQCMRLNLIAFVSGILVKIPAKKILRFKWSPLKAFVIVWLKVKSNLKALYYFQLQKYKITWISTFIFKWLATNFNFKSVGFKESFHLIFFFCIMHICKLVWPHF